MSSCTVAPSHSLCHNNPTLRRLSKLISNLSPKFMILLRHPKRWDMGPQEPAQPCPLTSDIWWPSVGTCSDMFTSQAPTRADIWWLLKQVRSAQAGGAHPAGMLSCWMWFLFPGPVFCGSIDINDPPFHPPPGVFFERIPITNLLSVL